MRDTRTLLAASFVDALGTGLFLPITVIYLTHAVGIAPARVGLGLGIAGAVAIAAAPLCGTLLDRFDARSLVLGCFTVSAVGFAAYAAVDSFASFLVVATVLQVANRFERPATAVLVLRATPDAVRTVALARQQVMRNAGYGVGALLAGLALIGNDRASYAAVLLANAASYAIAGILVARIPRAPAPHSEGLPHAAGYRSLLRDRPFVGLALLYVLVGMHDSLLRVAMPLWIATRTRAPISMTAVLFALNTVLVVVAQVRVTRRLAHARDLPPSYLRAGTSYVVCCGAFGAAAIAPTEVAIALLVVALTALTFAELETTAGEWVASSELAPAHLRGRYVSALKTSVSVQQAAGPALVTAILVAWGEAGWAVLAGMLAVATIASWAAASSAAGG